MINYKATASGSSSSVTATALVQTSNRRSSDADKQTLIRFGIANKEMQKSFLSLRDASRKPIIGLSCVEIPDLKALTSKCDDIINSVLAMNPERNTLEVLLPVQLMVRHGLPHVAKNQVRQVINTRLQAWATVLGFPAETLYPLFDGTNVAVKKGNIIYHFKPWAEQYLPKPLEARIDKLVQDTTSLFVEKYSYVDISQNNVEPVTPLSFLTRENNDLKAMLLKALTESIEEANLAKMPSTETLESTVNGVIFHTLLAMAHRHPELAEYAALLSPVNTKDKEAKKEINVAEIGTAMLHTLSKNSGHSRITVADEFAHGLAYIMEEISSPAILKQLEDEKAIMFYIPVKEQIRRTNPMRFIGAALKPSSLWPNLETCNSYETVEQRSEKRVEEELSKHNTKSPSSSPGSSDDEQILLTVASIVAAAAQRGLMTTPGREGIDPDRVSKVFTAVQQGFLPSDKRSRALSDHGSSSSSAGKNHSRNNSPGSGDEKDTVRAMTTPKPGGGAGGKGTTN